jgi:DNA-binding response OmpR family regulator
MPTKHVVICEDDLRNQVQIATHFGKMFEPQGVVEFSFVPGGMHAAALFGWRTVDLVLLDHDMPYGNGADLLKWMRSNGHKTPVLTFSGITENNNILMQLGANHYFGKGEIIEGKADALIRQILGV